MPPARLPHAVPSSQRHKRTRLSLVAPAIIAAVSVPDPSDDDRRGVHEETDRRPPPIWQKPDMPIVIFDYKPGQKGCGLVGGLQFDSALSLSG